MIIDELRDNAGCSTTNGRVYAVTKMGWRAGNAPRDELQKPTVSAFLVPVQSWREQNLEPDIFQKVKHNFLPLMIHKEYYLLAHTQSHWL